MERLVFVAYARASWSRARCDLLHVAFLVGFALIAWRLAIRYMERRLVL